MTLKKARYLFEVDRVLVFADSQASISCGCTVSISWQGTLQQWVGRLRRLHDGKRIVQVYDYADIREPILARMYERRLKSYAAIEYELVSVPPGNDQELTLDPASEN